MNESQYRKYLITKPLRVFLDSSANSRPVKGRTSPTQTYMSKELVPGANVFVEWGWIYHMPEPNPWLRKHLHPNDEVVIHIGSDPNNPEDLGAEIEAEMGDEKLIIDKTSAWYVPKGVPHTPLTFKKIERPIIEMTIIIGGEYSSKKL